MSLANDLQPTSQTLLSKQIALSMNTEKVSYLYESSCFTSYTEWLLRKHCCQSEREHHGQCQPFLADACPMLHRDVLCYAMLYYAM